MSAATTTTTPVTEGFTPVIYWHESPHPVYPFSAVAIKSCGGSPAKFHGATFEELQRHATWNGLRLEQVESREILRAIESLACSCSELTLERAKELAANIAAAS